MILARIGLGLLTLLVVSIVIFVLTQILPGDTASSVLGQNAHARDPRGLPPRTRARPTGCAALCHVAGRGAARRLRPGDDQQAGHRRRSGSAVQEHVVPRRLRGPDGAAAGDRLSASWPPSARDASRTGSPTSSRCSRSRLPEFFVGYLLILNLSVNHEWFPSLATVGTDTPFGETGLGRDPCRP